MSKLMKEEKGIALVTTILILLLLFTLGTALLSVSATEQKISLNQKRAVQALYLAEAGVNLALAELKVNPNLLNHTNQYILLSEPLALGGQQGFIKQVQLKKFYDQDNIQGVSIESLGEKSGQKRKVVVTVELIKNTAPRRVVAGSITLSNCTVNGDLYLLYEGNHYVDNVNGSIWVNGNLYVEGVVSGDVFATGQIVERKEGKIKGKKYEHVELKWEEIDIDAMLDWYAYTFGSDETEDVSDHPLVIIEGDANNHSLVNGLTNVVLGDVFFQENASFYGTLICGGTLELKNGNVTGIIIARYLNNNVNSGQAIITGDNYPPNIGEIILPPPYRETTINIIDWRDEKF